MSNTSRARRAIALAAATAVAGIASATVIQPGAAFSAPSRPAVAGTATNAPTVVALSPAVGNAAGGTPVVIAGTNLRGVTAVTFGDTPSTRVVNLSDTRIVAVAPAGDIGDVTVTVTTDAGSGTSSRTFGYRAALGAEFDTVGASAAGGTNIPVTVTGGTVGATLAEFTAMRITAKVGRLAAAVIWVDATHVQVVAPATTRAAATNLQLFHDGFGGPVSTSTVEYFPVVSGVSPTKISNEDDVTVTISGSGFLAVDPDDPDAVTFGGVPATSFDVVSASQISAEAPQADAAGTADVRVTTLSGISPESARAQILYRVPLGIDVSGGVPLKAAGGPLLLTITGDSLGADATAFAAEAVSVMMGSAKLTATYVDSEHLSVTTPAVTGEEATLQVVHDTVYGPPVTVPVRPSVVSLSETSDTVDGGKTVTVKVAGPGWATATDFLFGGNPAVCETRGTGSSLVYACVAPPASEAGPVWVSFTSGTGAQSTFSSPATFVYTDID